MEGRRQHQPLQVQPAGDGRDQRQAGSLDDEAATDPSSTGGEASSASTSMAPRSIADDTVLEDLMQNIQEDNFYEAGVDISPKRGGETVDEEIQSPSKASKPSTTRKAPRLGDGGDPTSTSTASGSDQPQPEGDAQV